MINGVNTEEIQEQINKLSSTILMEQQRVKGVRPADEDKKHLTDAALEEYAKDKGRGFFFNYLCSGRGHGPFTELVDGSIKYDLIGAIGPNLLGHSHPLYIKSHLEAATRDAMMCGNLLSYQEPYELTKTLLKNVKESNLKHFWFSGSGSFANDTALKILWQKKAPAYRLIACQKAFAGRSIATQDITYNEAYRDGMPKSIEVDHIPHFDQNDPENSLQNTLDALNDDYMKRYHIEQ